MKTPAPEFSRPLQVDRVPAGGSHERLRADPEELVALARRLDVPALHSLSAKLLASPWRGGGLKVTGEIVADVEQVSVVSLEAFQTTLRAPVERYFLPPHAFSRSSEEDADPIEAGSVDLGEVVTEALALELDPYPRQPGEDFTVSPVEEPETPGKSSPFEALKVLKDKQR
jgi:uncharacterized metal-binding protein YceD (DUF177 family)